MMPHLYDPGSRIEIRRAHPSVVRLSFNGAPRACAALLVLLQHAIPSNWVGHDELDPIVRAGFALSGFLMVGYLLRVRSDATDPTAVPVRVGGDSWLGSILKIVPLPYVAIALGAALYLPGTQMLAELRNSNPSGQLASLDRLAAASLAHLGSLSFDGWFRILWPVAALLAPTRLFSPILIAGLCSGPMFHFWGLAQADAHPAAILLAPSACDLLAMGAFLGIVCSRDEPGHGGLGFRPASIALTVVATSLGCYCGSRSPVVGSVSFLNAPGDFGILNYLVEFSALVLVASLLWNQGPTRITEIEGYPVS